MKRKPTKLLLLLLPLLMCGRAYSQGDAFFYENFEKEKNRVTETAAMTTGLTPEGLNFGEFSDDEHGLNFGEFSDDENGLNFGDYNTDEHGLKFGEFEMEAENVALGGGTLLLAGLSLFRLRKKLMKNN